MGRSIQLGCKEAAVKTTSMTLGGLVLSMLVAACVTAPATRPPEGLFNDHLFLAPSERISPADVFAISAEMKQYLDTQIAGQIRAKGPQQGLFDALYAKRQLMLDYDSAITRNAAQAFAARSGNCLSLVIMTAAFAKELGLPIRYQSAYLDETWSRDGDTYFFIGHVNVSLGKRAMDFGFGIREADQMTIDFLPPLEIRALRTHEVPEQTIVAMYMNNRAAEALTRGQLDDAYAWARAAIAEDPGFPNSYNTLGVIYQRHGNLAEAEKVLAYALEHEPENTRVMSNMVRVLDDRGRGAEARALAGRLTQLEPNPPFRDFNRRPQGHAGEGLPGRTRPVRQGSRSRTLLRRIPFLARRRLSWPRQDGAGAQGAGPCDGIQHDPQGSRLVRHETRQDQGEPTPVVPPGL